MLDEVARMLGCTVDRIVPTLDRRLSITKATTTDSSVPTLDDLGHAVQRLGDETPILASEVELEGKKLGEAAVALADSLHGIVCLVSHDNKRVRISVAVHKPLTKHWNARDILQNAIRIVGGRGGGKPHFAEGGGDDVSKVQEVVSKLPALAASTRH